VCGHGNPHCVRQRVPAVYGYVEEQNLGELLAFGLEKCWKRRSRDKGENIEIEVLVQSERS
jgi:hypothetical protein